MPETTIIPPEERFAGLKDFLIAQSKTVARIKNENTQLLPDTVSPFLFLAFPWLFEPSDVTQKEFLSARRREFEGVGFDGDAVRYSLNDILAKDTHLHECCGGPAQLAHFCDLAFITSASALVAANAPSEKLDELFRQFETVVYGQGRFTAISLCHLFNFQSNVQSLRFSDVRVERLDGPSISKILGETSAASFIHPHGTGDYFIVSELKGPCDDHIKWLFEEKNKAELFTHVLQYAKDGVVHIDYAAPHFLPQWVNQVRKFGIFFIGNPRRLPYERGERLYVLLDHERDTIARYWKAYQEPNTFKRISDLSHTLRQSGLRAAEYFEMNHAQEKPTDRLISLAVALEALFSPDDKGEFTFRISQSLSQLVGTSPEERAVLFKETKRFYAKRSELVHGQYDVRAFLEGRFVTHRECEQWASPIRRAILRFLTLYLRGENDRADVLNRLSLAALDSEIAERLRQESDPDTLLTEIVG
jgi:hypothetical protein